MHCYSYNFNRLKEKLIVKCFIALYRFFPSTYSIFYIECEFCIVQMMYSCRYRVSKILYVLHRIIVQIYKRTLNKLVDRLVGRTAISTLSNTKSNRIIMLSRNITFFSVLRQR